MFYYWKLFFSAYYTAYFLGEEKEPQVNAFYLMTLLMGVNLASLVNILHLLFIDSIPFFKTLYILAFVFSLVFNVSMIFFIGGGYRKKMKKFLHLSIREKGKERKSFLIITCVLTLVLLGVTGIINNPEIKKGFFNVI